ncbi:MAG: MBL fold metallo-hydrolase [Chloroflexota bacterium]
MPLKQLSTHVWLFPFEKGEHITQPNIGIIADGEHTVLIDAGNGAPHAERIKTAVFHQGFAPVSQIIYTHYHWDHVFGAHCFDVPIIANQRAVSYLERQRSYPWGKSFLQERWVKKPRMRAQVMEMLKSAGDWETFEIKMPTLVFDQQFELELPNVTLSLYHVGGIHAQDSIIVEVKDEGIVFVADSYYPPPTYEQEPGEEDYLDLEIIRDFLTPDADIYVDGHNKPFSTRQMQYLIRFHEMKQASAAK